MVFRGVDQIDCIVSPYYIGKFEPDLKHLAERQKSILNIVYSKGITSQQRMSDIYENLARIVNNTIKEGKIPLSISGDCFNCMGVLLGLQNASIFPSLLWFDAHGDFHTWETTESKYIGGMPLAMITGRGEQTIMKNIGLEHIDDNKICLINARSLEESERKAINESNLNHVKDISKLKIPEGPIHIHIDVDVLDPKYMPGLDYPVKKGISPIDLKNLFSKINSEGKVVSVSVSSWNPKKDKDRKAEKVVFDILDVFNKT